jgi:hypothetical protein
LENCFVRHPSSDPAYLVLHRNDVVEVLQRRNDGWWLGLDKAGKVGLFPVNYSTNAESVPDLMQKRLEKRLENERADGSVF